MIEPAPAPELHLLILVVRGGRQSSSPTGQTGVTLTEAWEVPCYQMIMSGEQRNERVERAGRREPTGTASARLSARFALTPTPSIVML
jgi:hypothetical protein